MNKIEGVTYTEGSAWFETSLERINQALSLGDVVGRSEQLVCDLCNEDGWITENKGDILEHRLCKCDKAN